MKKKIFFIMSTNDYSGAENVNFTIIENLKEKYDFYWVSRKGNINNYLKEKSIKWIEIEKLSVKEIKRVLKTYKPDILHATDYKASCIATIASNGIPVISHIHNNALWIKNINLKSIIFLIVSLKAEVIITVSDAINNEFVFSKLIKNKIKCLYNPVSYNKIRSMVNNEDFKKEYHICCCARLSEAKDPYRFLEIIKKIKEKIPNIKVVWIGDGEMKDEVREKSKEMDDCIDFIGRKKNPYKYMAKSKIFLLTSKWEGFGLAVYEALSLGLPAVVTNVGGLPYIVDSFSGFVCQSNYELVSNSIDLLTDEEFYNSYHLGAIKRAVSMDNLDKYILKLEEIYHELLRKKEKKI